jgi:hypothetical protein
MYRNCSYIYVEITYQIVEQIAASHLINAVYEIFNFFPKIVNKYYRYLRVSKLEEKKCLRDISDEIFVSFFSL